MKKGMRLSTILRKVDLIHMQNPIKPVRQDGYIVRSNGHAVEDHQIQCGFRNRPIMDKNRQILGDFYEFMTAGFYGGVVRRNIDVGNSAYVEPDVLNEETKQGFESKATHTSESLKLDDHQIQRYCRLQRHLRDYQFSFAVYRHCLGSLKDYEKENLFEVLSDKTLGAIVLPLSMVLQINQHRENGLVYRYEGDKWCNTTAVRSHTLNRFFGDLRKGSEREVVNELGLNPGDYEFKRLMSPLYFHIKGSKIKQFPIIHISDKDPEKWVEWFLENCVVQEELDFVSDAPF